MTAATVAINGHGFPEYSARPTCSRCSSISPNAAICPPFGGNIDYLTFGGIYRNVQLRVVPHLFLENVYAKPLDVLSDSRRVQVRCYLNGTGEGPITLETELRDGDRIVKRAASNITAGADFHDFTIDQLGPVDLWSVTKPKLYRIVVRLAGPNGARDQFETRIGFREAHFQPDGFFLNGERLKLRGLDRHQTYPFVGGAMPARVQRRDAWILPKDLHCNMVRFADGVHVPVGVIHENGQRALTALFQGFASPPSGLAGLGSIVPPLSR